MSTSNEGHPVEHDAAADEHNKALLALSPRQLTAIQQLSNRVSHQEAAKKAGVDPATLWRWMHHDPNFRTVLNVWSYEQVMSARLRFLGALDAVAEKLAWKAQNGWDDIALEMVRGFKVIKPPTGGDSPAAVKLEIDLEARQQEVLIAEQQAILRDKQIEHKERRLRRRALRSKLRKARRHLDAGNDPDRVNELGKNVAGGMDTAERTEKTR